MILASISLPAQEKWSASISMDGGTDFKKSLLYEKNSNTEGNLGLGVKYKSEKFWFGAGFNFLNKYNTQEINGFTIKGSEEAAKINSDILISQNPQNEYKINLNSGYMLSERDILTFDISETISGKDPDKIVLTLDLISEDQPFNSSYESGNYNTYSTKSNINWKRKYDKAGRELNVSAIYNNTINLHENEWIKLDGNIEEENMENLNVLNDYRINQRFQEHNISILSGFKEKGLGGVEGLDSEFNLDAILKVNLDHYASDTLKTEVWKEGKNEDFIYFSAIVSPSANIKWYKGKIGVETKLSPQIYLYRLDDYTHKGDINCTANPLGTFDFKWNITEKQTLSLAFKENISRPEYLNMCWFRRQGNYINELYEGNVDLKPSRSSEISLIYGFNPGKFHIRAELKNNYTDRKIESTYNNIGNFRIYTWINGGHSNTTGAILNMGWKNSIVSADLTGILNNFNGVSRSGNRTISNDYNIAGNVSCNFKHGWIANISGRYQSDIKRSYATMTDYINCNVKVSKKFKKFELYAEGRDLFDKTIVFGTVSEDETQFRYEERNFNRRIMKLGININF